MSMILFSRILNPVSASWFTEGNRIAFMIGLVAGADLGLIFAAICMAAGKDDKK